MFESAAPLISDYLLTGMHHSTKDAQEKIRLIIQKCVHDEFMKLTPSEFCSIIHHSKQENEYEI